MRVLSTSRRIDKLNGLCIPKEYIDILNIKEKDYIIISLADEKITLERLNNKVSYENILKRIIVEERGNRYIDCLISDDDVDKFKELVISFIKDNIEIIDDID